MNSNWGYKVFIEVLWNEGTDKEEECSIIDRMIDMLELENEQ